MERLKALRVILVSFCPYYYSCGGCHLEQLDYSEQLEFKKDKALNILNRYAGINLDKISIIDSVDKYYRNKVVFHIEGDKIGYYEEGRINYLI